MKFYMYSCMVMCVVDFIKSYRLMKYRKHVDSQLEMIRATMNIFLPIYRLLMLISNLSIIFRITCNDRRCGNVKWREGGFKWIEMI